MKYQQFYFRGTQGWRGGNALAKILYGDVNPSGKLPFTIAKNDEDYPYFNPFTDTITYGYYHGYTLFEKYDKEIAYHFGHGLSYSNFLIDNFRIIDNNTDKIVFSTDIKNNSKIKGKEVLQLYVGFENSKINRPLKLLRDFKKLELEPGEKKTVLLSVDIEDLAYYNDEEKRWEVEDIKYNFYVGNSSDNKKLIKIEKDLKSI